MTKNALWQYFRELNAVVSAANKGGGSQPYKRGTFMVTALAGDVELAIKDVTEEDAILIAAELKSKGAKVQVNGSLLCPVCRRRVPDLTYCAVCRAKLTRDEPNK